MMETVFKKGIKDSVLLKFWSLKMELLERCLSASKKASRFFAEKIAEADMLDYDDYGFETHESFVESIEQTGQCRGFLSKWDS